MKDRIKCVFYIDKKRKGQSVRKFQKGKRDFFKNFTILSSVLFFCVLHSAIWIPKLQYQSEKSRLSEDIVYSNFFRRQPVSDEVLKKLKESEDPGKFLGLYWLESDFEREKTVGDITKSENRWKKAERWNSYVSVCRAIWNDLEYFPVAETNFGKANVSFSDSWMLDRTYKGDRKHEGTDIMPSVNKRDYFPVVSMTDGIVTSVGWLELGGYRVGITSPGGAYFYYAHLSSYAGIKEGDPISAGDVIGFMGDTGYSKREGTTGGIGELANFLMGASYVLTAGFIYKYKKTRKMAMWACVISSVVMGIAAAIANYFILLPLFETFMPLEQLYHMCWHF